MGQVELQRQGEVWDVSWWMRLFDSVVVFDYFLVDITVGIFDSAIVQSARLNDFH